MTCVQHAVQPPARATDGYRGSTHQECQRDFWRFPFDVAGFEDTRGACSQRRATVSKYRERWQSQVRERLGHRSGGLDV